MRILVVEDDTDISTLISFHLRSNGFESDSARYQGWKCLSTSGRKPLIAGFL